MSVFCYIQPFDDEMASFLDETGAAVPESDRPARNPTPAEVRAVCAALPELDVEFNVKPTSHWQAVIKSVQRDERTILKMEKFDGAEDVPLAVVFEGGSVWLILEVVQRLASDCGPLVVIPDTGETPIAVTAASSVPTLLKEWQQTAEDE